VPGVVAYAVDLRTNSATVLFDPAAVRVEDLQQAVRLAGFRVGAARDVTE
jgi:copper chaperone CopZ